MKYKKYISSLVIVIVLLSAAATVCGLLPGAGHEYVFKSLHGETVTIYGRGLYQYDSVASVVQTKAQDFVTLLLGIPMLIIALIMSLKGQLRGRLLLAGTLGYFLYTYMSYSFLAMYNYMFLAYVLLMSASFFAFVLTLMSFDVQSLSRSFAEEFPVRLIGGVLIFVAVGIALMWLGRIVPPLAAGSQPQGLEHYTTLVIQVMDLGFVVPAALVAGLLILKRKAFGFLLAPVIIIKSATLLIAITAMAVMMVVSGEAVNYIEMAVFLIFDFLVVFCLYIVMKNIKEPKSGLAAD